MIPTSNSANSELACFVRCRTTSGSGALSPILFGLLGDHAGPVVATLATILCVYLMLNLSGETWERFLIWMALGFVVYFLYGRRHSRLAIAEREDAAA